MKNNEGGFEKRQRIGAEQIPYASEYNDVTRRFQTLTRESVFLDEAAKGVVLETLNVGVKKFTMDILDRGKVYSGMTDQEEMWSFLKDHVAKKAIQRLDPTQQHMLIDFWGSIPAE